MYLIYEIDSSLWWGVLDLWDRFLLVTRCTWFMRWIPPCDEVYLIYEIDSSLWRGVLDLWDRVLLVPRCTWFMRWIPPCAKVYLIYEIDSSLWQGVLDLWDRVLLVPRDVRHIPWCYKAFYLQCTFVRLMVTASTTISSTFKTEILLKVAFIERQLPLPI